MLVVAAVLLQNAGAALSLPVISVVQRSAGVSVEHPTQPGVFYQMESSADLAAWEPSGPAHYGTGSLFSAIVYVPPPPPDDPNPAPPWDTPARWLSFFVSPISTSQTVVGFFAEGRFQRVLLTSSNFLTPNFRMHVAIRQNEGTPSNPSDDVVVDCDFLLFATSRDLLLLPRSDEDFPGISAPHKADLQRLIAARMDLIAANQAANANPLPVGPPLPPGPKRYYRLKISTLDSDGDGVYDSNEFIAGTNPYANPSLNPPGNAATASNPTGLTWKPFWKRNLPQVSIQQKWRTAAITIREGNPDFGTENSEMSRAGAIANHSMSAARTTGLESPVPLLSQVRLNPRNEITKAWASGPAVVLEPLNTSPEWTPWVSTNNQPLQARYRCAQAPPGGEILPLGKWRWILNGEERIFRITCATSPPEDITRHFLHVKRYRRWLGAEGVPDWTYDYTTVLTLTIAKGSIPATAGDVVAPEPVHLSFFPLSYAEKASPAEYTAKTTEIEEICLPVEITSPTRQTGGTMLGKSGGARPQIYVPELRIAKLFPGKDAADVSYSPIQSVSPFAIVPEEDPDSYIIRVHDVSGVWQQLSNPTAKPGIRITTATPSPYEQFHSEQSTNPALYQVDAANPSMAPGWLTTKSMLLVSNSGDNNQPINGAKDGARNDPSRIVLPGGTVTVAFPGWQRSTSPIPTDKVVSINLPVPIAAKATLDMKIFEDAPTAGSASLLFASQIQDANEHFAQAGIVFNKTPDSPPMVFQDGPLNSQIPHFYISNLRPSPLAPQVRELALLAGRVTGNGLAPNLTYARNDAHLGILFCANQLGGPQGISVGVALMPLSMEAADLPFAGNFFHMYSTNAGDISGYNPRTTSHELGTY
jgi:hypothetical protein